VKYLIAILAFLGGCAFVSGPCIVFVDQLERVLFCENGGNMMVLPSNILEIDSEGIMLRK
jgi:hypothetical protein